MVRHLSLPLVMLLAAVGGHSAANEFERLGKATKTAVEDAGKAAEKAAKSGGEAVKDAGKAAEKAAKTAVEEVEEEYNENLNPANLAPENKPYCACYRETTDPLSVHHRDTYHSRVGADFVKGRVAVKVGDANIIWVREGGCGQHAAKDCEPRAQD